MDKSLELEFAKFETEVARTEMYGTMLDDALNMYNYVRTTMSVIMVLIVHLLVCMVTTSAHFSIDQ